MTRYSFSQLERLWVHAQGQPVLAPQMAAVALAESKGKLTAWNPDDPYGGSYGLWQINGIHPFNAQRLRHDAAYNAKAAVYVYHIQGPNAWSVYRHGSYLSYVPSLHAKRHRTKPHHPTRRHHIAHRLPPTYPPHTMHPQVLQPQAAVITLPVEALSTTTIFFTFAVMIASASSGVKALSKEPIQRAGYFAPHR